MRPVDRRIGLQHVVVFVLAVVLLLQQLAIRIGTHVEPLAHRHHHVGLAVHPLAVEGAALRCGQHEGMHRKAGATTDGTVFHRADEGQRRALGGVVEGHLLVLAIRRTGDQPARVHVDVHQPAARREVAVGQVLCARLQAGRGRLVIGAEAGSLAIGQDVAAIAIAAIHHIGVGLRHHGLPRNALGRRDQRLRGTGGRVEGIDLRGRHAGTHIHPALLVHGNGARILRPRFIGHGAVLFHRATVRRVGHQLVVRIGGRPDAPAPILRQAHGRLALGLADEAEALRCHVEFDEVVVEQRIEAVLR